MPTKAPVLTTQERDIDAFWDRVTQTVLDGKIEFSEEEINVIADPPLLAEFGHFWPKSQTSREWICRVFF